MANVYTAPWPEERLAKLVELWKEGLSATQCSKALGDGLTRSAVIGMVHRRPDLFAKRGSPINKATLRRRPENSPKLRSKRWEKAVVTLAPVTIETVPAVFPTPEPPVIQWPILQEPGIPFMELRETTCKYPLEGPTKPPYRFCGASAVEGHSWCKEHKKIVYQTYGGRG